MKAQDIFHSCFKEQYVKAQMSTLAVWHPDVFDYIKAKREDGRLRQFNLSLLLDDEFIEAVKNEETYKLVFPITEKELESFPTVDTVWKPIFWEKDYCRGMGYILKDKEILCKVYEEINAKVLWDTVMKSTYDFAEPGVLFIDKINKENNNWFCETIRSTNPCKDAARLH